MATTEIRTTTYREALREAIVEAMEADERVFLMGEDVGAYGGCYAVSKGLLDHFGEERIRDTPLSESGFVGAGIGAAMAGMRPIVEVMTVNFSLLALDQIVNNAATLRHMSGGQLGVPLVIRMATGAGRQLAAQHSHSLEGWYAHVPGLKVVAPATVADARTMLAAALADPDPVVMFEHVGLYGVSGPVPDEPAPPLHKAVVRRAGTDVTLITHGGSLPKALAAADELAAAGISAEVIDLRSLRPLDDETFCSSVSRTGPPRRRTHRRGRQQRQRPQPQPPPPCGSNATPGTLARDTGEPWRARQLLPPLPSLLLPALSSLLLPLLLLLPLPLALPALRTALRPALGHAL